MIRIAKHLPKLATLGALIVLAACAESGTAPAAALDDQVAPAAMPSVVAAEAIVVEPSDTPAVGPHGTYATVYPSNAVTYQFTVNPTLDASFNLGTHLVKFPKYTICDPATSGYGPSTWLNSCTKLASNITITATTWTDSQGRPQIDFSNAIRFYKNWNNQLPAIYLKDPSAAITSWGRVDYCTFTSSCVNEAATDATLATQRDSATGYLFRLIRHFSGYNVWA